MVKILPVWKWKQAGLDTSREERSWPPLFKDIYCMWVDVVSDRQTELTDNPAGLPPGEYKRNGADIVVIDPAEWGDESDE